MMISMIAMALAGNALPRVGYDCALFAAWDRKATPKEQDEAKSFMLEGAEQSGTRFFLVEDVDKKKVEIRVDGNDTLRIKGEHEFVDFTDEKATEVHLYSFSVIGAPFSDEVCAQGTKNNHGCASIMKFLDMRGSVGKDQLFVGLSPSPDLRSPQGALRYYSIIGRCVNKRVVN